MTNREALANALASHQRTLRLLRYLRLGFFCALLSLTVVTGLAALNHFEAPNSAPSAPEGKQGNNPPAPRTQTSGRY